MRADIAWWDLNGTGQTPASLQEHLQEEAGAWSRVPGLALKFWIADPATTRWGAVMLWHGDRPPAAEMPPNLGAALLGGPPDHRSTFDVQAVVPQIPAARESAHSRPWQPGSAPDA
ncbi:hypothetical protein [Nocardiopsis halophila]|uniref:hypothetical protein n=1 Tax=Nocardiopsis halophila TaxID=141692 RepID=UPI000348367A|nr:hypothetical protein [Nocardiopsis halophila]